MPDAGAAVSPWPAGGKLPGLAEVHLPSAGPAKTIQDLHIRQVEKAAASESEDAHSGGDPQQPQAERSGTLGPLHPTKGTASPNMNTAAR